MKRITFVLSALVALAFCVLPAAAFAGEDIAMRDIAMAQLGNVLQNIDLTPILAPLIVWVSMYGISWAKGGVTAFLNARNAKRALKVLNVCSQAVDFVAKQGGVNAMKAALKEANPNASLPDDKKEEAMQSAITKTREIAAKKGLTRLLPRDDVDLELLLERVLAGHKKGEYNAPLPFAKAAALAPLPIQGWVPSGSAPADGSAG